MSGRSVWSLGLKGGKRTEDFFIEEALQKQEIVNASPPRSLSSEDNTVILEAESFFHPWRFTEESKRNLNHVNIWEWGEEQGRTLDPGGG